MEAPLSYENSKSVLEYLRIGKRKALATACPSIRSQDAILPYHVDKGCIRQDPKSHRMSIILDSFIASFEKVEIRTQVKQKKKVWISYDDNQSKVIISDMSEGTTRKVTVVDLSINEAAERWALYILSRRGTKIRFFELNEHPVCLLRCEPMVVSRLALAVDGSPPEGYTTWIPTCNRPEFLEISGLYDDETAKRAKHFHYHYYPLSTEKIAELYEWGNCDKLTIDAEMTPSQLLEYSKKIAERPRPIGYVFSSRRERPNFENSIVDWMAVMNKGRKTLWNGRKCATLPSNELSELNVHGNMDDLSTYVVMEVNEKGTASDR